MLQICVSKVGLKYFNNIPLYSYFLVVIPKGFLLQDKSYGPALILNLTKLILCLNIDSYCRPVQTSHRTPYGDVFILSLEILDCHERQTYSSDELKCTSSRVRFVHITATLINAFSVGTLLSPLWYQPLPCTIMLIIWCHFEDRLSSNCCDATVLV